MVVMALIHLPFTSN